MDTLTIPPSPNWYQQDVMACAPDNTIIFGARQDIVVIKHFPSSIGRVDVLTKAHLTKVSSVNINRNWGAPSRYAVTVAGEDRVVKLWDIDILQKIDHYKHVTPFDNSKVVTAVFAGDNRVVSTSEKGTVFISNTAIHELTSVRYFADNNKATVTCFSLCPHATWLAAFGLKSGLIVVVDLRKDGKTLYQLRGHSKQVISLAWCPAPINIFPYKPQNRVIEKKLEHSGSKANRRKQRDPKKHLSVWTESFNVKLTPGCQLMVRRLGGKTRRSHKIRRNDFKVAEIMTKKITLSSLDGETPPLTSISGADNEADISKRFKQSCILDDSLKSGGSASDSSDAYFDAPSEPEVENWRERPMVQEPVVEMPLVVDEEPRKEFLLASSALEPNIYIWRAGSDGRMQTLLTAPAPHRQKNKKKGKYTPDKYWIVLCWATPTILFSSSPNAQLLRWDLPKPLQTVKYPTGVHRLHWSTLFCIKAPIVYSNEYNFLQAGASNVWTTGMDRYLLNTDIKSTEVIDNYPTLAGSVNCIAGSLVNPSTLAIGLGDGVIGIWNTIDPRILNWHTLYDNILGPVTALTWHPSKEDLLAWGTEEGRVGIFEAASRHKRPKVLRHYFKTKIFKMEWGPMGRQTLFVVSEGKVAIFDTQANQENPQLLQLPDNTTVYTMAWKPDYSMLLVASKEGSLIEYTPDLSIKQVHYISTKIQSILWHPSAFTSDINVSEHCNWFAAVNNRIDVTVFDVAIEVDNFDSRAVHRHSNAKSKNITDMAWNPFVSDELVWVDEMGVARVISVNKKIILAVFLNPSLNPLQSVHWSPSNPDCVIVGSTANKLMIWKLSQNLAGSDEIVSERRKAIAKALQVETHALIEPQERVKEPEETKESKVKSSASRLVPLFYSLKESARVEDIKKVLQWKRRGAQTDIKVIVGEGTQFDVLEIFADKEYLNRIFDVNLIAFRKQKAHSLAGTLMLFQGDFAKAVDFAIENKCVDTWILSLAPMISDKTWQKACETFVEQLLSQPDASPLEIATYMLALHRVTDAIDFLCDRQMFREAFALAKARFGAGGFVEEDILEKWGQHNVYQGQFEFAACCYIMAGKFEKAAWLLFRRPVIDILELAAELAKIAGNHDLRQAAENKMNALKNNMMGCEGPSTDAEQNLGDYEKINNVIEEATSKETKLDMVVEDSKQSTTQIVDQADFISEIATQHLTSGPLDSSHFEESPEKSSCEANQDESTQSSGLPNLKKPRTKTPKLNDGSGESASEAAGRLDLEDKGSDSKQYQADQGSSSAMVIEEEKSTPVGNEK